MPAILKHLDCPSCGTRHHFCLPIGELTPGREYEYVCPNTAKKATLRSASPAEVCPSAPQGAVALTPGKYTPPEGKDSGPGKHSATRNSDQVAPAGAGLHDVQHAVHEIGDEVHDLSNRVGELEQRVNAAPTTTQPTTPASAPSAGSLRLGEVLPKVKDLAGKVGGMEQLSEIVEELEETQEWTCGVRLATHYTVLPQETDEAVDEPYDLCILDGAALDRLADRIQDRKKYQQTVFLPFLLVTAEQQVGLLTRQLWKSIDEVIHSPIDKVELQARIEVLLRTRRQALALRQAGERALRQSEERLGLMIEGLQDYALFLMDPGGQVSGWNAGAERLLGYEAEEIIGQPFSQFFTPEDRLTGKPERELEIARTTGRASDDNWLVQKDGSRFWASGITTAFP